MGDKHYRSLIKGVSWRFLGTVTTVVISFYLTGKINVALSIGAVEFISKIVLYYFHERVWDKIKFGKK